MVGLKPKEKGVALVTALVTATAVFLLAGAVLTISMQRFQLAVTHSNRRAAFYASEAGVRYAFSRLDLDLGPPSLKTKVFNKSCNPPPGNDYVISSKGVGDEPNKLELRMGTYDVTVVITYRPPSGQPCSATAGDYVVRGVAEPVLTS